MEILIVKDIENKELCNGWDQFVRSHPLGTIFQSPDYFSIFLHQKEFEPIAVLLQNDHGEISGVLSGIIQYQFRGPLKAISSRCVVIGGPIVQNNDPGLLKELLSNFNADIKQRVIYTQFRNMSDMGFAIRTFMELSYKYEEHLNIHVNLKQGTDDLWKDVHKQKQYEVKRAEREGLIFGPIVNSVDLEESYKLLKSIYTRIKLPLFPYSVFENTYNKLSPKGTACFWAAFSEGKLVATMYTLCYRGRIYNYFAGSDSLQSHKFPNSLVAWQVMLWGKNNGMTLFDWGGAGKPGIPYGVRDFKSKFGGQMVNYGRFEKIHKPILYRLATYALKLYKSIK
jgi:serine/alanine adding enzyme